MTLKHIALLLAIALMSSVLTAQTCAGIFGPNINIEGDFGFGTDNIRPDTLFLNTNLIYTQNFPPPDSFYTIANSTFDWGDFAVDFWIETEDNSGDPAGYMMIINGLEGVFYERTLDLCDAVTYQFSFDAINLFDPNQTGFPLPNLELLVDGVLVEAFGELPQDGQWHSYTVELSKDVNAAQLTIALNNLTASGAGNDFAIDNVSLQMCQHSTTVAEVDPQPRCPGEDVTLSATNNPGFSDAWYQWQISTNDGQNWNNFGDPTNDSLFVANDIPVRARFRVISARSEGDLFSPFCRVISDNVVTIQYNAIIDCASAISSIGDLCTGELGPNVFPNGDFGSGTETDIQVDPGLAPGYIYQPMPPPDDGLYTITNNTSNWGGFAADSWINIGDNSDDPNGYMMVVNASSEPGLFFEQTVQICENTTYEFSADVISMNIPELFDFQEPNISFLIDGVELFATGNVPVDSTWRSYGFSFTTAPGVTEITLALRNNSPGGAEFPGNDLAIDNISLRTCGPSITVPDSIAICSSDPFDIVATIQEGVYDDPVFQWQFSADEGNTWDDLPGETDLTLILDSASQTGQYRLLAANGEASITQPNCRVISAPVVIDIQRVSVNISETRCAGETYTLGSQSITTSGVYTEIFTTPEGCDSTVTLDIQFNPVFTEDITETLCEGQSYTFGNQTITTSGMYTETFQSVNGCDSIVNLNITFNTSITQNISETICEGESYTFGNQTLTASGSYQEIFTASSGCDSIVNLELTVVSTITTSENIQLCAGESYQGMVFTQDTTLTATFTSSAGCDSTVNLAIQVLPSYNEVFETSICAGDVFQGIPIQNDTSFQIQMTSQIGCDSTITYYVTVENPGDFQIQGLNQICTGDTITLSANGNFAEYKWSTGDTSATIEVSQAGTYAVEVTTASGCIANDEINISETSLSATATVTNPVCPDDNGRISIDAVQGGIGPYLYGLAGESLTETSIIGGLSAGTYEVVVQDAAGCEWRDLVTVEAPRRLDVSITAPEQLNLGDSATIEVFAPFPIESFAWSPAVGLSCTDCQNPTVNPEASTAYTLTITDDRGCTISERVFINVVVVRNVFAPTAFSPNGDGVNDVFTLFTDNRVVRINTFVIFDRWGNQLYAVDNQLPDSPQLSWDGNFNGREVNEGVYVWIAEVEYTDNFTEVLSGDVTLVK